MNILDTQSSHGFIAFIDVHVIKISIETIISLKSIQGARFQWFYNLMEIWLFEETFLE